MCTALDAVDCQKFMQDANKLPEFGSVQDQVYTQDWWIMHYIYRCIFGPGIYTGLVDNALYI